MAEDIPDELLERLANNETWMRYFVLVGDLDIFRATIEHIPQLYIVRKTFNN